MSALRFLFASVVFLASFLLFLVEPMAGRQLLPILGGSAAVWITCLVFFQAALLLGYLLAHLFACWSSPLAYVGILLPAMAAALLWVVRTMRMENGAAHPVATVFVVLSVSIGLPFLMLSATSPLLQVWWARVEGGGVPYRLYALSNAGSLLALVLYPTVIEPHSTLHAQRVAWASGFAVFAALSVVLALKVRGTEIATVSVEENAATASASDWSKVMWVLLPMGAAMQLSAITGYLTANVAAIPLLWVLPLGVYLITLILAFEFRFTMPWAFVARVMVVMLAALAYSLSKTDVSWPLWVSLLFFLAELFFACFFCHSAAAGLRPERTSEATLFYLLFAAGGALGSFLIGIAAPIMLRYNLDLPITFLVTALLALALNWQNNWSQRLLWGAASAAMLALVCLVTLAYQRGSLVAARNFYASLRVTEDSTGPHATKMITLTNGSIRHGTQMVDGGALRRIPTTYYANGSGVGLAIRHCCGGSNRPRRIGVIGLGAGTVAAYGRAGDAMRFYEINPAVVPIARDTFWYLRDSAAKIEIVEGDARTSLAREASQKFDVLVVDAFSGDAIPIHLLTTEAMALYRRHLAPHGVLAFHISNQHVDLAPVIELLAESAGMQARYVQAGVGEQEPGAYTSAWMLVTDDAGFFAQPEVAPFAEVQKPRQDLKVWTDDYSALLPLLRW
jgi:hypothetical protein